MSKMFDNLTPSDGYIVAGFVGSLTLPAIVSVVAGLVTIVYGCLRIYYMVKDRSNRDDS